jgi:hypothetical protein
MKPVGFHQLRVIRVCGRSLAAAVAFAVGLASVSAIATPAASIADQVVATASPSAFDVFLDRLMTAESAGRVNAKNPRSTALGPFQFIKSTFLELTRRHFSADIAGLSDAQILARRTDPDLSRRAAAVFCEESVRYLKEQGLEPTFGHLRLAYLLGPADAARIMQAEQQTPVVRLLSPAVIRANPFMRNMRVNDLIAKSERDVSRERTASQTPAPPTSSATAGIETRTVRRSKECNRKLSSCRKFRTLHASGKARRA